MVDHIHASFLTGLTTFAWVLVFGFLWRAAAFRMLDRSQDTPGPESTLAKGMLTVY